MSQGTYIDIFEAKFFCLSMCVYMCAFPSTEKSTEKEMKND